MRRPYPHLPCAGIARCDVKIQSAWGDGIPVWMPMRFNDTGRDSLRFFGHLFKRLPIKLGVTSSARASVRGAAGGCVIFLGLG